MKPSKEDLARWREKTLTEYDFDCEGIYVSETVRLPKAHVIALLDLVEEQNTIIEYYAGNTHESVTTKAREWLSKVWGG